MAHRGGGVSWDNVGDVEVLQLSHLNLHDCYYITHYVKPDGERYYFLECNPGYPNMPRINGVKSVEWNSRLIVIKQEFSD